MPTYLSLFSFLERKRTPFKVTWFPLMLFTTQIIGATMFLRWHYLVDICAGITLAVSAVLMSRVALRWDAARERCGGSPAWLGPFAAPSERERESRSPEHAIQGE